MPNQVATSIIQSVVQTQLSIEAINKVCGPGRLKEPKFEGLAEEFHAVLEHLPVIERSLQSIKHRLSKRSASGETDEETQSYPLVLQPIDECNTKATQMKNIYQAVIPGDAESRGTRHHESISGCEDKTVVLLMRDILVSMLKVVESSPHLIGEKEKSGLKEALEDVKKPAASLMEQPRTGNVYTITNSSSGLQPVHAGYGSQHILGHNMGGHFYGGTNIHPDKH